MRIFDEGSAVMRKALQDTADEKWSEPWKLSAGPRTIFEGSRFLAFRQMYINHIVHHRAQLGVYLRLNDEPVPSIYGPVSRRTLGF